MSDRRPIFGIFEGGGAKGIAHVGALAAAEANGLAFAGVAGASAGAIVATLVAAGLPAKDILDPNTPGSHILARHRTSTTAVLGDAEWRRFGLLRRAGRGTFLSPTALGVLWGIYKRRGHFSTDGVRALVNEVLRECLLDVYADAGRSREEVPDRILFRHLDYETFPVFRPLKIVATDLGQRALTIFDRNLTPDVEIGEAVAASVAIPLVFRPVAITSYDRPGCGPFVDGGLVSNAPVWVFAEEKLAIERASPSDPPVPIISFTLVDKKERRQPVPAPVPDTEEASAVAAPDLGHGQAAEVRQGGGRTTVGFLADLARTAIFGSQGISQRFIEDLLVVRLETRLDVLDFDASWSDVADAHRDGRRAAAETLKATLTLKPERIRQELRAAHAALRARIDQRRAERGVPPLTQLRANLFERAGQFSFRVTSALNMDEDADDRLLLDLRARGAPDAFRERSLILLSAGPAATAFEPAYMTKYERALIRPTMHTAICTPVFREVDAWTKLAAERPEPIGIFCVDSDEDLTGDFNDQDVQTQFVERSSVLSSLFT